MTGEEMRAIRVEQLEMNRLQLARAIGYTGNDRNDEDRIRRMEHGVIPIPLYIARLVWLIGQIEQDTKLNSPDMWNTEIVDEDGKIDWPKWPGYDFISMPDGG